MSTDKYLRGDILYSSFFILIGIAALVGYIIGFQKDVMFGLMIGFIPTGIGMLSIYLITKKHPGAARNMQLEKEERNIFINSKAGYTAFWISYWYVFIASVFRNVVNVSMHNFTIFTLIFMPVVYFLFVVIYHRKY